MVLFHIYHRVKKNIAYARSHQLSAAFLHLRAHFAFIPALFPSKDLSYHKMWCRNISTPSYIEYFKMDHFVPLMLAKANQGTLPHSSNDCLHYVVFTRVIINLQPSVLNMSWLDLLLSHFTILCRISWVFLFSHLPSLWCGMVILSIEKCFFIVCLRILICSRYIWTFFLVLVSVSNLHVFSNYAYHHPNQKHVKGFNRFFVATQWTTPNWWMFSIWCKKEQNNKSHWESRNWKKSEYFLSVCLLGI